MHGTFLFKSTIKLIHNKFLIKLLKVIERKKYKFLDLRRDKHAYSLTIWRLLNFENGR